MKYLLIRLACVAGYAKVCPDDGGKNAMAPAGSKVVAAARAAPTSTPAATSHTTRTVTEVAAKSVTAARKSAHAGVLAH